MKNSNIFRGGGTPSVPRVPGFYETVYWHRQHCAAYLICTCIVCTFRQITRIENAYLYGLYAMTRDKMIADNGPSVENERLLWHGTAPGTVDIICHRGFNRSHCGKNGRTIIQRCNFIYQKHRLKSNKELHWIKCRLLIFSFVGTLVDWCRDRGLLTQKLHIIRQCLLWATGIQSFWPYAVWAYFWGPFRSALDVFCKQTCLFIITINILVSCVWNIRLVNLCLVNCICFMICLVFNTLAAYWPFVVFNKWNEMFMRTIQCKSAKNICQSLSLFLGINNANICCYLLN